MPAKNQLYKKVLDTAPFGTVFFAYGVCIDANAQALSILKCDRAQIIGAAISEDQNHQPQSIQQLKQVVRKLQDDQLKGILWRSENTLEQDEIVVSVGSVEKAEEADDGVLCLMLYPLPSLAQMVVQEFVTEDLTTLETSPQSPEIIDQQPLEKPEEIPAAQTLSEEQQLEPEVQLEPNNSLSLRYWMNKVPSPKVLKPISMKPSPACQSARD